MNNSAQCRSRLTKAIASTPGGHARLDRLTEKENRHLAEHLQRQMEGHPAPAQGGMSSSSSGGQALEAVPPVPHI